MSSSTQTLGRIMVVDDYGDIRRMMQASLTGAGYSVVSCENGADALRKFLDYFKCRDNAGILMDLALPDINGMRVMSAIREIEKGSTTECVPIKLGVISANGDVVTGTDVFEGLNVTLQVPKPFEVTELMNAVRKWMTEPAPEIYVPKPRKFVSGAGVGPRLLSGS